MSSNKKKKHRKRKPEKAPFDPRHQINVFFKDRHPVFRFLFGFIVCMVVFYLFYYSSFYRNILEEPFLQLQAKISNALLRLFGHNTVADKTFISSSDFAVNIKNGCDGLEAIAIFVSGIVIFPAAIKLKLKGIAWGVLTLFVLNLFRIAGLYLIGLNFSTAVFDIMHVQGGFILFTMISVVLLFIWINWVGKKTAAA